MSSINGLGGASPLQQPQNITSKPLAATSEPKKSLQDRLELSGASHLLQTLKTSDIRTDKVAALKAQIADGTYDADGSKLDGAIDRVLDEI